MKIDKTNLVKDIMTKEVITISPESLLLEASEKMMKFEFNGLPVVDQKNKVVGIITEYDLLTKGTAIHLPTFIKLFGQYPEEPDEKFLIKGQLKDILAFTVKDVMNPEPLVIREYATIADVVRVFAEHHRVNPIPIVNQEGRLLGVVSRFDVIRHYASMLRKVEKEYQKRSPNRM